MSGIAPNPLTDISKVYLEAVAAKPDFLDLDKDGNKKEPMKKAAKEVEAPKERLKTDRNMFNVPKDEQKAAKERLLAKARAKREKMKEGLDPVGQEDADIDNDGDTDKSDKYLHKRRKAIAKAMKKRMSEGVRDVDPEKGTKERKERLEKKRGMKLDDHPEYKKEETEISEIHVQAHQPHEVPSKNLKGLVSKAVKRIDADNDGDIDKDDPKEKGMGEYVPSADGKKKVRTKIGESVSNWRQDLSEVMDDDIDSKPIKEKKINNKIKINPKLGEAVEQLGGEIIEMVQVEEGDIIESVYDELVEEGYSQDEVEYGIDIALNTLEEGYYDSAVASSKAAAERNKPERSLKDRIKSAAKKAIAGTARAAGKVMKTKAQVQAAPGRAKAKVKSLADRVKSTAKAGYASGRGPVEKKTSYRGAGVGRKEKIGEEIAIDENVATGKARRAKFGGIQSKPVGAVSNDEKAAEYAKQSAAKKAKEKSAGEAAHKAASAKGLSPAEAEMRRKAAERKAARMRKEEVEQLDEISAQLAHTASMKADEVARKARVAGDKETAAKKTAQASRIYKGVGPRRTKERMKEEVVDEKLNLKKADMGDVIKDFYKSDAPQFKGRSKEKRREMAIAAKLTAERGGRRLGESSTEVAMSPQELALQKRKTAIDKMITMKRQQALQKTKKEEVVREGDGDPCWDTHKQVGMKKKGNRMVPNCVPKNKVAEENEDSLRDRRMERGGVDGNTDYRRPPAKKATNAELGIKPGKTAVQKELEKKHGKGKSAMDIVKAEIRAKHGKGSVK
jgi:hypothetical protein